MAPKVNVKERYNDGEVDLSMSDLSDVPVKDIQSLKRVYSLDLSNNSLIVLPKTFTSLTSLTVLDLSKNELKEIPEDIGSLVKLRHLDLYRNQLQHLPLSFGKLKNLKFLDLKDNPLVPAVAKVAGLCIDTKGCHDCAKNVVAFFSKLASQVSVELESREKDRQRQLELNQRKKQEEKNSKKKEKQKEKKNPITKSTQDKKDDNLEKPNSIIRTQKSIGNEQKSSSALVYLFKFLFFLITIYFAYIFFKLYNSSDKVNSYSQIILQDLQKVTELFNNCWSLSKRYIKNTSVLFFEK